MSTAAQSGEPAMTTLRATVPVSVPHAGGAPGFTGDVTATTVSRFYRARYQAGRARQSAAPAAKRRRRRRRRRERRQRTPASRRPLNGRRSSSRKPPTESQEEEEDKKQKPQPTTDSDRHAAPADSDAANPPSQP